MKKVLLVKLMILILLFAMLAGCTGGEQTTGNDIKQDVKNPDTFVHATKGVETLDNHLMSSVDATGVSQNVHDSLLAGEVGEDIEPSLSVEVPSEDNNLINIKENGKVTIEFPLREGVKFHNGDILTPEDVKYTFMRGIVSGRFFEISGSLIGKANYKDLVEEIGEDKAFEKLDTAIAVKNNSVVFNLIEPFQVFLDITADNGRRFGIMNKSWCIENGAWDGTKENIEEIISLTVEDSPLHDKMMGTGPFKFSSWDPDERLVLERFDDYWKGPAQVERVVRRVVPDDDTAVLLLQQGDVDFADLTKPDLKRIEGREGVKVIKDVPAAQLIKINFNFDIQGDRYRGSGELGDGIPADFFSDLDLRRAFAHSFDHDTFVDDVLLGAGKTPYGPVLVDFPTANPENPRYELDLEKAEKYFKKAWNGEVWEKGFKFTIPYSADCYHRPYALEILKDGLRQINPEFKIELASMPWSSYLGAWQDRIMPISVIGILPRYDHPYYSLSHHMYSRGTYPPLQGYVEMAEEKYDPLIKELGRTLDEERIEELSHELQRLAYEDAHSIFHYQVVAQFAMRDWIQGYQQSPFPAVVDYYHISKGY